MTDETSIDILERIHRLSHHGLRGTEKALKNLKLEYNQMISLKYNDKSGISYNIIEVLPPEVWIPIIQESLPWDNYSSALLILTLVSNEWRNAITSVPVLWTHIQVRESAEDSLAIVETFRQLSCDALLVLTIYSSIGIDWMELGSILSTISSRLRKVEITYERDPQLISRANNIGLDLRMLLGLSQHISGVVEINLNHGNATGVNYMSPDKIPWANLPKGIRAIKGWCFHSEDIVELREVAQGFHEMESCIPIDGFIHIFGSHSQIQSITSSMTFAPPSYDIGTSSNDYISLSNLMILSYKSTYRTMLMDLMRAVGPNLVKLDLKVPFPKVTELYLNLEGMHKLQSLDLNIVNWKDFDDGDGVIRLTMAHPNPVSEVSSLRSLVLSTHDPVSNDGDIGSKSRILQYLIRNFHFLYRAVEYASFYITLPDIISHLLDYISELPMLKILRLNGDQEVILSDRKVTLLTLENLDIVSDMLLANMWTPSRLLSLRLTWGDHCRKGGIISQIDLVKLFLTISDDDDVELPTTSFPSLRHLSISFLDGGGKFHLTSLPFLTSLSIHANPDGLQATALCFELLYQPDTCPSLNEIRLPKCAPEWDILFLMLERRNFLLDRSISRIRRITLPFVLDELRAPLASLLRSLFTERPSNEELSSTTARSMLFNPDVTGCYACIRSLLSPCKRTVDSGVSWGYPIYIMDAQPPPDMDFVTLEWIHKRNELVARWKKDESEFTYSRTAYCPKIFHAKPVEITEHDQISDGN